MFEDLQEMYGVLLRGSMEEVVNIKHMLNDMGVKVWDIIKVNVQDEDDPNISDRLYGLTCHSTSRALDEMKLIFRKHFTHEGFTIYYY